MSTTCEFRFGFWDVTARADAAFQVTDNQPWARIEDMNLEEGATFPDVVTLEPGFGWPLTGAKAWFPAVPTAVTWGWWSEQLSRADGTFTHPPTLTVTFTENHSSAGITFRFIATLPRSINIKWYSLTGVLLADRDFTPDRMEYFCDYQVENYGKVIVTIPAMSAAHRYLRCAFILFGVLEIIDGQRVQKAELCEEISPVGLALPIDTLGLSFFTPGGRFSLLDPSGAYRLFQWKQQITAYATVDGVQRPMGVYYLQELLDAILGPEDVDYTLDPSFAGVTVTGYLPICSKREALQQIAFALGAIVDTTRGEVMRFYPMPTGAHHAIAPARKIVGHKVTLEELVTRVDVTAHAYRLNEEVRELTKTTLEVGRHRLTFTGPVKVTGVTGGTLVESHPNYAVVNVGKAGEVILTGQEYVDDTRIFTVQTEPLPAGAKNSTRAITEATLIDAAKAPAAARRIYAYYQLRYTDEGQLLPGAEQVGQWVELQSLGGRTLAGPVERLTIDLAGGYLATLTMRGG